jgi:hypothetical protein
VKVTSASGITSGVNVITKIATVIDANNFTVDAAYVGTFTGSGTVTVVNNISILTKKFNPYISNGSQVRLGRADLYLDKTTNGQITVNVYINEDNSTPINAPSLPSISTVNSLITNITSANPAVISVPIPALFNVNDVVYFGGVNGMTQINELSSFVSRTYHYYSGYRFFGIFFIHIGRRYL